MTFGVCGCNSGGIASLHIIGIAFFFFFVNQKIKSSLHVSSSIFVMVGRFSYLDYFWMLYFNRRVTFAEHYPQYTVFDWNVMAISMESKICIGNEGIVEINERSPGNGYRPNSWDGIES